MMKPIKLTTAALSMLMVSTAGALAASHGNANVMSSTVGGVTYIMNKAHMALYTYDRDQPGVSNCYGECAAKWPPATLEPDADMPESYTLIKRKDGAMQIAFKGKPLYSWTKDRKIGDISGDGVGGVWRLARP